MLGFYNYTVVLTYIGMLTSFAGIVYAMAGNISTALFCLMVSGFCDMFDGKIASTMERTRQEKNFGIQIDSLSDLICFGALPAIIVHRLSPDSLLIGCVCGLYLLCALIRLAYFNVDEAERQAMTEGPREFYLGLPVTTSALILPFVCALSKHNVAIWAAFALFAMAIAFITPFKIKKPALRGKIVMIVAGLSEVIFVIGKGFML